MGENIKSARAGNAYALKWTLIAAGLLAILSLYVAPLPAVQVRVVRILPSLIQFVPSVASISSETSDYEASEIILLTQWLFIPAYIVAFFYRLAPWSRHMRDIAASRSLAVTPLQRMVVLPVGVLVTCAWILGDLGLIAFPTLYNGRFVYPLAHAAPQLRIIYTSSIAFAIYAWIGPIVEVGLLWILCTVMVNAKTYFSPKSE